MKFRMFLFLFGIIAVGYLSCSAPSPSGQWNLAQLDSVLKLQIDSFSNAEKRRMDSLVLQEARTLADSLGAHASTYIKNRPIQNDKTRPSVLPTTDTALLNDIK